MTENDDDDFIHYIKRGQDVRHSCCSWKKCCISTCLLWTTASLAIATTVGVLIWKKYIVIDFQNPNYIFDY